MGALCVAYVAVKLLPATLASSDGLTPNEVVEEQGRIRTALVTLAAGAAAGVGAIYTARTFALNRRGQVTERFTRAIDQLGHAESLDVRLGGIYALGQLVRDSPSDHGAIIEILTAYVREHSAWPPRNSSSEQEQPLLVNADVQAVVTLLRRRDLAEDQAQDIVIDLASTDLRGVHGRELSLAQAHLSSSQLQDALLMDADLSGAMLVGANMEGTTLIGANLREAVMRRTVLRSAHLEGADLRAAKLQRADLREATYNESTEWAGARYDRNTLWPDDAFDPSDHGCIAD